MLLLLGFNSKLVRLKAIRHLLLGLSGMFQFQIGAIKRKNNRAARKEQKEEFQFQIGAIKRL